MADAKPWDDPSLKPKGIRRFVPSPPKKRTPAKGKPKQPSEEAGEIAEEIRRRNEALVERYGEPKKKKKRKSDPKKGAF